MFGTKKLTFTGIIAPLAKIKEELKSLETQNLETISGNKDTISALQKENCVAQDEIELAQAAAANIAALFSPAAKAPVSK